MSGTDIALAPSAVVRVAGWPLSAMDDLGDEGVAQYAQGVTPKDAGWSEYLERYREVVERERRVLWQRTVQDARFLRAVAVVNPTLATGLEGREISPTRNKKARHYETTLYRYLARAVGRAEPCGMWSGVTQARWGAVRRMRATKAAVCVAPDLAPFREMVLSLGEREPYRGRALYKLNPTLRRHADGAFTFWSEPGRGRPATERRLTGSAGLDAVIEAFVRAERWTRSEAATVAGGAVPLSAERCERLVQTLLEQSVFVGGVSFPRAFTDPWDALDQVGRWLEPEHAARWARATSSLADVAANLASILDSCSPGAVVEAMEYAGREVEQLARDLGLDIERPRAPLRCDFAAPWSIELGADDRETLETCVDAFSRYQGADCLHGAVLAAATDMMLPQQTTALADVAPPQIVDAQDGLATWDALTDVLGASDGLRQRVLRQDGCLQRPVEDAWVSCDAAATGPHLASAYVALGNAEVGGRPIVFGLSLDPTSAYARFAPVFALSGPDRLFPWFLRQFAGTSHSPEYVELRYDHRRPNVLARPSLWAHNIDPWGVTPGSLGLAGLQLRATQSGLRLVLPGSERPLVAVAPTAAAAPADDPCVNALLLSSHHLPPLVRGGQLVHQCEAQRSAYRPRLRLDDGSVVQTRRTLIRGEEVQLLVSVRGATRFANWQRMARQYGWPRLLSIARDNHPPLLVDRDSPLAIESAFEGGRRTRVLRVEEFASAAWVGENDDERRYVAQIVLPFVRTSGARETRCSPAVVGPVQREAGRCQRLIHSQ